MNKHVEFLNYVQAYVSEHPEVSAYVQEYVAAGVLNSLRQTQERAADMEVALAVSLASRYKNREELILSKLTKWKDKASLRWDDTITMLEGKK